MHLNLKNLFMAALFLLTAGVPAQVVNGDFSKVNVVVWPEGWQCVSQGEKRDGITACNQTLGR